MLYDELPLPYDDSANTHWLGFALNHPATLPYKKLDDNKGLYTAAIASHLAYVTSESVCH